MYYWVVPAEVSAAGRVLCLEMPSASCKGRGGLDTVELVHASGATATVYLWGATLTSYCTAQREEMIFVSPGAVFDGTQP